MEINAETIAQHYEELVTKGKELDHLVPVTAHVKSNADTVYSTRYSRDEIAMVREAARKRGMTPSAFIRTAALSAASGELGLEPASHVEALEAVKAKTRELAEAVSHLP